ncbi:SDR family NAD(P)-dependent oxidoreductase [Rugosimonospora africana]|uniref:3-oxoacyl-ACP reductase n=1 Tax=Rugosimonospora africana TaxID=556532 RepID=A0A8J3QZM6_9ACTN|nr:SDR family NAD(P)-dependent oxidoreductase [Rugosimonospora africana]GIH20265.1 3-oxoacyl-ACP reductase [Rugosimonospora africana]
MSQPEQGPMSGRIALVTGASGGIGGALALRLAAAGADLALTYSGHRQAAEGVAEQARALGRRAAVLAADLTDPRIATDLVDQVGTRLGPLDILIANAGTGRQLSWDDDALDVATWDSTMAVNLRAPWLLTRAALPGMVSRGFGRVLYVSSIAALNGGIVGPHYAASKAGLHGLMHHLAGRVAGHGVTVNTIAPALITGTGFFPAAPGEMPMPVPVGRLGRTEDVADLAMAMLTNGYLTNKVVTVDGGLYPT